MRNLLALAVLVLGVSSCDTRRRSLFQPAPTVVGSYTLRTVNGKILPYAISTAGTATKSLTGDTLALRTDNTVREVSVYTTTDVNTSVTPTVETVLTGGSYSLLGTVVSLTLGSAAVTGTYSGGTLTLIDGSATLVYQR